MLVQDFLRKQSLEKLEEYYGIKNTKHEDGRVILNYSQIDSAKHKTNPIVRECRGLVLDSNNDWALVARSFNRFFNLGETDDDKNFDWSDFHASDKEDGSLILVYPWKGEMHLNTRGSFGDGEVGSSGITWRELFTLALPYWKELNVYSNITYCFELCSRYNKVVRDYEKPTAFLLSVFDGEKELDAYESFCYADSVVNCAFVDCKDFDSEEEILSTIKQMEEIDPTFEGYVLRDRNNLRIKAKSSTYLALHRLNNNGNIAHVKNILPLIMKGELDEVLSYFPELTDRIRMVESQVQHWKEDLDKWWFVHHDERSQKKFALAVKDHPLSFYLFQARKLGTDPVKEMHNNPETLLKVIQNGQPKN